MKNISACLLVSVLATTGCSITGSEDISPLNLNGMVAGQSWSFNTGHTSAFLSEGESDFFATLYPTAFTPCGFVDPGGPHIIVSIPKTPGDYEMGFDRNMTFVDENRNLVAFDGRIVVDEVSATQIVGGLHGNYDFDNEVNGRFAVTICPD